MITCSDTLRGKIVPLLGMMAICLFACRTSKTGIATKKITAADTIWNSIRMAAFAERMETLRQRYHIPGLSLGIVNAGQLAWKTGLGYADVTTKSVPDENTVYQVASVTKTFGSLILLQQVEAGKISLDDPISKYGINLGARWGSDPRIKLKHLLTHTAMGNTLNSFKPGYVFRYNGAWYNQLQKPIEKASGHTFGELLMQQVITPLGLKNTVPSTDDSASFALTGYDKDSFLHRVARPYDWKQGQLVPVTFNYGFGPAAGLMSTVADLAVYSTAIDQGKFLGDSTWRMAFTRYVTPRGKKIQYGLGWFVGKYKGVKVVWHTGWWTGYSALFVKVPEKDLAFIVLANSQDLSRPFYHIVSPMPMLTMFNPFRNNLNRHISASGFAKAFLDLFLD
ncbi:beta-lactamase family protein [Chitinophaga polysaccharea]|uniref:serine hydrolase domain-containing protein n=1 Tax=Chitinophaga polysaccharea TaxID=1293035 RepID=UPI001454FAED|nr:serine hydrolase domain-containing protein [Chitinophaga polysaccharea]NLR57349.1 beta-lactamase family protein [Chitinophaga polysaccharea]